jgi:hypothetical protein
MRRVALSCDRCQVQTDVVEQLHVSRLELVDDSERTLYGSTLNVDLCDGCMVALRAFLGRNTVIP